MKQGNLRYLIDDRRRVVNIKLVGPNTHLDVLMLVAELAANPSYSRSHHIRIDARGLVLDLSKHSLKELLKAVVPTLASEHGTVLLVDSGFETLVSYLTNVFRGEFPEFKVFENPEDAFDSFPSKEETPLPRSQSTLLS